MTEDADKRFNGLNLKAGIKVRKLLIELGIRTEDAECNLRGVKVIFNLFVIVIAVCKVVIPSSPLNAPVASGATTLSAILASVGRTVLAKKDASAPRNPPFLL